MIERDLVAEKISLVRGHGFDHVHHQRRRGRALHTANEFAEICKSIPPRDGKKAAFQKILLLGRERQAGALLQQLAQPVEILGGHDRAPANSRFSRGAMSGSGSTAEQRPACATCPGIPQTTLVGSSCATTLPPVETTSCA